MTIQNTGGSGVNGTGVNDSVSPTVTITTTATATLQPRKRLSPSPPTTAGTANNIDGAIYDHRQPDQQRVSCGVDIESSAVRSPTPTISEQHDHQHDRGCNSQARHPAVDLGSATTVFEHHYGDDRQQQYHHSAAGTAYRSMAATAPARSGRTPVRRPSTAAADSATPANHFDDRTEHPPIELRTHIAISTTASTAAERQFQINEQHRFNTVGRRRNRHSDRHRQSYMAAVDDNIIDANTAAGQPRRRQRHRGRQRRRERRQRRRRRSIVDQQHDQGYATATASCSRPRRHRHRISRSPTTLSPRRTIRRNAGNGIRVDAGNGTERRRRGFPGHFRQYQRRQQRRAAGIGLRKHGTVATTNDFGIFDAAGGPTLAADRHCACRRFRQRSEPERRERSAPAIAY